MTKFAIEIKQLTKKYQTLVAVDNISLTVQPGELFGLIGPDGAGKTSVMRILCGLLSFDGGECFVGEFNLNKQLKKIKKIIGYMPQRFSLYPDLTVSENLRFFSELFNVSKNEREKRLERLLQFSKLSPFQKRRAADLSGGMKQKLALSCTLIHTPTILILDEPTTGVDPVSRREFWKILAELQKEGVTIFVSTPYMDEAQKCDRIALMHNGKILASDVPENIANYFPKQLIEIQSRNLYRTMDQLTQISMIHSVQLFGDKIHATVNDFHEIEQYLNNNGIEYISIKMITPGIEDVFIELMKE